MVVGDNCAVTAGGDVAIKMEGEDEVALRKQLTDRALGRGVGIDRVANEARPEPVKLESKRRSRLASCASKRRKTHLARRADRVCAHVLPSKPVADAEDVDRELRRGLDDINGVAGGA